MGLNPLSTTLRSTLLISFSWRSRSPGWKERRASALGFEWKATTIDTRFGLLESVPHEYADFLAMPHEKGRGCEWRWRGTYVNRDRGHSS